MSDRPLVFLANAVFEFRSAECHTVTSERPTEGLWFAIQARTVKFPEGPRRMQVQDGGSVEEFAVVTCILNENGEWEWLALSPPTKQALEHSLHHNQAPRDVWLYCIVHHSVAERDQWLRENIVEN